MVYVTIEKVKQKKSDTMKTTTKSRIAQFVSDYKKAIVLTGQGGKVKVVWYGSYLDRQNLKELFMQGLHHKINIRGKIKEEYRESWNDFWIDGQILAAWKQRRQKTQYGLKFKTRYFKKRFSIIELQLQNRFCQEGLEPTLLLPAKLKESDPYHLIKEWAKYNCNL